MQLIAVFVTPLISIASCVIVLSLLSLSVYGETLEISESDPEWPSELPCPDADVIDPCLCTFHEQNGMDIDCSAVSSEDELRSIFSNDFSFTDFSKFSMTGNHNITTLSEGDFGSASFKEILIQSSSLQEVQKGSLKGSHHTLVTLGINFSKLSSIPDISNFTRLETLQLWGNKISQIPMQTSATLSTLDLRSNHIDDVPEDAITALTSLEKLLLKTNFLTEIHPDTFTRNKNLNYLDLGDNKLTTIPNDAITLYGENTTLIIYQNQIANFSYGAVSSVSKDLDVALNRLTELPEHVFRPLLERYVDVELYDNPFKCGCDLAWLILNQELLQRLPDLDDEGRRPTCRDGEAFTHLDPEMFKTMCPNATAVPV